MENPVTAEGHQAECEICDTETTCYYVVPDAGTPATPDQRAGCNLCRDCIRVHAEGWHIIDHWTGERLQLPDVT